jgi:hypothetical protein
MDERENSPGDDSGATPSDEVARLVLHLMAIRSAVRVGFALNEQFDTEESFTDFLNSAETLDGLQEFVNAERDIALLAMTDAGTDTRALADAVRQHHGRALESVDLLAEAVGVQPEDLFSFLLRA